MKLNITSKLLSLLAVAALTFTSCGDDKDDVTPVVGQTSCKLTTINDDGDESTAVYNANGYISEVTGTYTDGGVEVDYTYKYTYQNNKLVKEEQFEDGEAAGVVTYTYNNDMVSTISYEYDEFAYTETYTYDGNKRVSKVVDSEGFVTTYTYSGNNASKSVTTYEDEVVSEVKYENYDNKLTPTAAVKGLINLSAGSSVNNPGRVTYTYYYGGGEDVDVSNYTYQYNSSNLPTRITETDGDGDTYVTNITYDCN